MNEEPMNEGPLVEEPLIEAPVTEATGNEGPTAGAPAKAARPRVNVSLRRLSLRRLSLSHVSLVVSIVTLALVGSLFARPVPDSAGRYERDISAIQASLRQVASDLDGVTLVLSGASAPAGGDQSWSGDVVASLTAIEKSTGSFADRLAAISEELIAVDYKVGQVCRATRNTDC